MLNAPLAHVALTAPPGADHGPLVLSVIAILTGVPGHVPELNVAANPGNPDTSIVFPEVHCDEVSVRHDVIVKYRIGVPVAWTCVTGSLMLATTLSFAHDVVFESELHVGGVGVGYVAETSVGTFIVRLVKYWLVSGGGQHCVTESAAVVAVAST